MDVHHFVSWTTPKSPTLQPGSSSSTRTKPGFFAFLETWGPLVLAFQADKLAALKFPISFPGLATSKPLSPAPSEAFLSSVVETATPAVARFPASRGSEHACQLGPVSSSWLSSAVSCPFPTPVVDSLATQIMLQLPDLASSAVFGRPRFQHRRSQRVMLCSHSTRGVFRLPRTWPSLVVRRHSSGRPPRTVHVCRCNLSYYKRRWPQRKTFDESGAGFPVRLKEHGCR